MTSVTVSSSAARSRLCVLPCWPYAESTAATRPVRPSHPAGFKESSHQMAFPVAVRAAPQSCAIAAMRCRPLPHSSLSAQVSVKGAGEGMAPVMDLQPDASIPQFKNERGGDVPADMLDDVGSKLGSDEFGLRRDR